MNDEGRKFITDMLHSLKGQARKLAFSLPEGKDKQVAQQLWFDLEDLKNKISNEDYSE